jgi:hypothetical protein
MENETDVLTAAWLVNAAIEAQDFIAGLTEVQ